MKDLRYFVETVYKNEEDIKYFEKTTSEYVVLDNDCCLLLEKQHIKKNFCFGYYYDVSEVEGCEELAQNVEYFLEKNRRNLYKKSEKYVALNSYESGKILRYVPLEEYQDAEREGQLFWYGNNLEPYFLNDSENERLNNAIDKANAKFEKRLQTYLKKYGLSKVNTWTYWANE